MLLSSQGMSEIKDSSSSEVKRVGGDQPAAKRAKSEATSPSPPLKVYIFLLLLLLKIK